MIIAQHEFIESGWRWRYELHPDRLFLIGVRGSERQQFEMDLKHANPTPDRWLEEYSYRCPRWLWLITVASMGLTLLPCCGVFGAADGLRRHIVPPMWIPNILTITIFALAAESLGVFLIPRIFGIKHFRWSVRYKRSSDGGELVRFTSALNQTDEAFDEFVSTVSATIAALHQGPEPPPSHAFSATRY